MQPPTQCSFTTSYLGLHRAFARWSDHPLRLVWRMPAPLPISTNFPASIPRGPCRVRFLLFKRGQYRPVLQDLLSPTVKRRTCPTALILSHPLCLVAWARSAPCLKPTPFQCAVALRDRNPCIYFIPLIRAVSREFGSIFAPANPAVWRHRGQELLPWGPSYHLAAVRNLAFIGHHALAILV